LASSAKLSFDRLVQTKVRREAVDAGVILAGKVAYLGAFDFDDTSAEIS
jgi:hypothetical protein